MQLDRKKLEKAEKKIQQTEYIPTDTLITSMNEVQRSMQGKVAAASYVNGYQDAMNDLIKLLATKVRVNKTQDKLRRERDLLRMENEQLRKR